MFYPTRIKNHCRLVTNFQRTKRNTISREKGHKSHSASKRRSTVSSIENKLSPKTNLAIPQPIKPRINFWCCAPLKQTFWELNVWCFCVGGKCCPHINKAVDLTGVKKALRAGGIINDCTDCAKMPATNNGLPAGEEVGGVRYMLPSACECCSLL